MQGKGKLTLNNGTVIKGKWNCNIIEGEATVSYPSGDIYFGPY